MYIDTILIQVLNNEQVLLQISALGSIAGTMDSTTMCKHYIILKPMIIIN